MKRKKFLEKIGIGAAFALTATCLGGCSKDEAPLPKDLDFKIDLGDIKYQELLTLGGYVIENEVVIARSLSGDYIAATITCSHDSFKEITYRGSERIWFCTEHGAKFDEEGAGLNPLGNKGLTIFKTEVIENSLRIFN